MSKGEKTHIERNAKALFPEGRALKVVMRGNTEEVGVATIQRATREEIEAHVQGRQFGFDGQTLHFRIPSLTQKGGDLALSLA